jgi:hypothetical protein
LAQTNASVLHSHFEPAMSAKGGAVEPSPVSFGEEGHTLPAQTPGEARPEREDQGGQGVVLERLRRGRSALCD